MDPATEEAASAALPDTLTLHGRSGELKLRLVRPASLGVRASLGYAVAKTDEERVFAAALWHCSGAVRQHVRDTGKVATLGAAVLDWLLGEGVSYLEAYQAGQVAWLTCIRDLPDWGGASMQAGFSGPGTGGSTG